jgi:hypothetical protein
VLAVGVAITSGGGALMVGVGGLGVGVSSSEEPHARTVSSTTDIKTPSNCLIPKRILMSITPLSLNQTIIKQRDLANI